MTFIETVQIAWEGSKLNRIRSFLTTLGVIIGVASVITMLAVSAGAEAAIANRSTRSAPTSSSSARCAGARQQPNLTYEDAVAIEQGVRNTAGVSAEFQVVQNVSSSCAVWTA